MIDVHVHIVGNGKSGSGCRLRQKGYNRLLSYFMLREMGLARSSLQGDLDHAFKNRLLTFVRESLLSKAVILALDEVYDQQGRVLEGVSSLYVPNEYVLSLSKQHSEFLAGVSIHPARPDALDELERCLEQGAALLKLLPNCHNVDCGNSKYKAFWRRMAEAGLPFLAHTGGELSLPVVRRDFQSPQVLRPVLDEGVTVIAAHVASASFPFDTNYFADYLALTKIYPNLYGDISALNTPFRSSVIKHCLAPEVQARLVHGSDLPIPNQPRWAYYRGLINKAQYKELKNIANPLERDVRLKQELGFVSEVFTRATNLLRTT